jgi:hypothetical protein
MRKWSKQSKTNGILKKSKSDVFIPKESQVKNNGISNKGNARRGICPPEWEVVCGCMEDKV